MKDEQTKKIYFSVVISTYNRPDALELVLRALADQDVGDSLEVVVADDGSDKKTEMLLKDLRKTLPYPLSHVWHEHEGFRAGTIRNKAARKARGDYLVFLDGDTVPQRSFIRRHRQLAEKNYFVVGNRLLLSQKFTSKVLEQNLPIYSWGKWRWAWARLRGQINKFLALFYLPFPWLRKLRCDVWRGAKSCNLGIWREDFFAVQGFDEDYRGWGYEDSDLVVRMLKKGLKRKDGHFATAVLHLWHPANYESKENCNNYAKLIKRLQD
jgi:glycosyltransferase involved in cell wall biosynthesis